MVNCMDDDGVNRHKRQRMSPPMSPNPNRDHEDNMETTGQEGTQQSADSDASSDWGDWANLQEAQGEPPGEKEAVAAAEGAGSTDNRSEDEDDDEWVRSQMAQPSAVVDADNRAWDYVLRMVVDEGEQAPAAATMATPVQEIRGTAATEFVSRWLRGNLPISLPSSNTLSLMSTSLNRGFCRRAVADSVASPSAVAIVSRSPEQVMHRINLFSLSANAGSALAAALVQPGAAGLLAPAALSHEDPETEVRNSSSSSSSTATTTDNLSGERSARAGGGRSDRGVVFESLDSRILEGALVSAMGRLGLDVKYRSRCGLWRLRPGTVLLPPAESTRRLAPLNLEDAGLIASCCSRSSGGVTPGEHAVGGAEAIVRGLIQRNPSAGIRIGNQLVAWCLSFDNGLAGALHVAVPPPETRFPLPTPTPTASPPPQGGGQEGTGGEEGGFSSQNLVLALVASLLAQPSEAESSASNAISKDDDDDSTADAGMAEYQPGHIGSSARGGGSIEGGLAAVVIDDDAPFVSLFQELGLLERVCDADWVRFSSSSSSSSRSSAPAILADECKAKRLGGAAEPLQLPVAALVMQP